MISFEFTAEDLTLDKITPGPNLESGLHTSFTAGLSNDEDTSAREQAFGINRIPTSKGKSVWRITWNTLKDPMLRLLIVAALVSLGLSFWEGDEDDEENEDVDASEQKPKTNLNWVEGAAILLTVTAITLISTAIEWRNQRRFAQLNKQGEDRSVVVIRSGSPSQVSIYDLLVGDVVQLEPGDVVPADGILIEGDGISCDESSTTGESELVQKMPLNTTSLDFDVAEKTSPSSLAVISGTKVMKGTGKFLVTAVGQNSVYGKMMASLQSEPESTPLQKKLARLGRQISIVAGVTGLLVFLGLLLRFFLKSRKEDLGVKDGFQKFFKILIQALALVVAAVPEGLPLAVAIALAAATRRMQKEGNLVRYLASCETMGNATTICADKTGTLTQNRMSLVAGLLGTSHSLSLQDSGIVGEDTIRTVDNEVEKSTAPSNFASEWIDGMGTNVKNLLISSFVINSSAFEENTGEGPKFVGSRTEGALLEFATSHMGVDSLQAARANANILQVMPFNSEAKYMATAARLPTGAVRVYIKGAPEILLAFASFVLKPSSSEGGSSNLDAATESELLEQIDSYASRSLRTIAFLYADFPSWPPEGMENPEDGTKVDFEHLARRAQWVWIGFVGIQDPLRPNVRQAVEDCQSAGVIVRMVTGDNLHTAQAIAEASGIYHPDTKEIIMEGAEFRKLNDSALTEIVPHLRVLARSSPEDKRTLVNKLQELGETVAVTGDGTNDAPALNKADVGFSMGVSGTEVARKASDIVLLDDNFASIVSALMWGRSINDAVRKFLQVS